MNKNSIVDKFANYCGGLHATPYHFVQGAIKYNFGLTFELGTVLSYLKDSPSTEGLEKSFTIEDQNISFDDADIMKAKRFLQNAPFSKVKMICFPSKAMPVFFYREDVAILLSPYILPVPKEDVEVNEVKKFKGNPWLKDKFEIAWIRQLHPNSTFWLCQFVTPPNTYTAMMYGYPIGTMIKCKVCGCEIDVVTYSQQLLKNHPECMCSCDTYDDFCGCKWKRIQATYDRIRRESTIKKHFMQRAYWDVT